MSWFAITLRRLRRDRAAAVGLVALVFVTTFVFAVAPRALATVADAALRQEMAAATSVDRDIRLDQVVPPSTPDSRASDVAAQGDALASQLPAPLRAVAGAPPSYVVETPLWHALSGTPIDNVIALRIQQDVQAHLTLTGGRWPTGTTTSAPDRIPGAIPRATITTFEAAIADDAAQALQVGVGTHLVLAPEPTDPYAVGRQMHAAVIIVGTYRPTDRADPYWIDDATVEGATIRALDPEHPKVDTSLLLSPDAYPALLTTAIPRPATDDEPVPLESILPLHYEWRFYLDVDQMRSTQVGPLIQAMRRTESLFPVGVPAINGPAAARVSLQSGLLHLLEQHQARWVAAQAVLAVAAIGSGAVAVATLGLVILLAARQRRRTIVVARERGASRGQLVLATLLEGAVIIGPPAVAAVLLARALVPATIGHLTLAAAVVVAAGALALFVLAVATALVGPLRGQGAGPAAARRASGRRVVLEALFVVGAAGAAVVLRQRGLVAPAVPATALPPSGPDLAIAAVPALVGLAAGLVALRLYPWPMRGLAYLAARRRGVVPVLAWRRATRGGPGGVVLLILLTCTASAAFAAATLVHLDSGAELAAWQTVGAPYELVSRGGLLPSSIVPASLPGVTTAASGFTAQVTLSTGSIRQLVAVDAPQYETIARGTPVDPQLPAAMLSPRADPLPVAVSPSLASEDHPLKLGDVFQVTVAGIRVNLQVAAFRSSFPTLALDAPFVLVARQQLAALAPPGLPGPSFAFLAAPDGALAAITTASAGAPAGSDVQVVQRTAVAQANRAMPATLAVVEGVAAAAILSFAYAALAVAAALALAAAGRAVEAAHLQTLGLTRRQAVLLVATEFGPMVLVAFLGGLLLGAGLFIFLEDSLGLADLIGSPVVVPFGLAPVDLVVLVVLLAGIVAVGIGTAAKLERSQMPANAVRQGIE
ncbi:MAG TPA: FtsX-like permease family protein [Candidatus Baltobacteraceae bacterium]|nr:FtsX-like permease family protein [Candidatus Baltobacteraceae bacterium]